MSEIAQEVMDAVKKGYNGAKIENWILELDNYGQSLHSKVILKNLNGDELRFKTSSHLSDREPWYKFCKKIKYVRKKAIVDKNGVIENWDEFEAKIKGEDSALIKFILLFGVPTLATLGLYLAFTVGSQV